MLATDPLDAIIMAPISFVLGVIVGVLFSHRYHVSRIDKDDPLP